MSQERDVNNGVWMNGRANRAGWMLSILAGGVMSCAAMGQGGGKPPDAPGGDDKPKVNVSEHMTVDLSVKDESIVNVLELLSVQSQKNIIASKNVSGKVSADLFKVTFYEALDALLHVNGFEWQEKGNFIYVYTREEYAELQKSLMRRTSKVVRLNYLSAVDAAEFVKPLLSNGGGEIKTTSKVESFMIPEQTPTGKDDMALGATLVVIDYEENIAAIEKLLKELDTKPAQVLIEATILQTKLTEENAFGVDLSIIANVGFIDFLGGPTQVANSLIKGGAATPTGYAPPSNNATGIATSVGDVTKPGSLKVAVISDYVSVFVRMLDEVSDTVVISNPKILALNRQPSRVLVGQRLGYVSTTSSETSTTQTVQFLNTGTQLYFRPFVSNSGDIRMELKPQVSTGEIQTQTTVSGAVSVPVEDTQEIVTNVIVKDGSTIVLGGLFTETNTSGKKQVPFLGDIPIIGAAFRGNSDKTDRNELIFLVRPTIVNDTSMAMQGVDVKSEIERVRAGQRQGLLPWSRDKMTSALNVEAEEAARAGDTNKSLFLLQRSLSLKPIQPDALQLRERLTGEREVWPDRMILDDILDGEARQRMQGIKPPEVPITPPTPEGWMKIPEQKINPVTGQTEWSESTNDFHHLHLDPSAAAHPAESRDVASASNTSKSRTLSTDPKTAEQQAMGVNPSVVVAAPIEAADKPAMALSFNLGELNDASSSVVVAKPTAVQPIDSDEQLQVVASADTGTAMVSQAIKPVPAQPIAFAVFPIGPFYQFAPFRAAMAMIQQQQAQQTAAASQAQQAEQPTVAEVPTAKE